MNSQQRTFIQFQVLNLHRNIFMRKIKLESFLGIHGLKKKKIFLKATLLQNVNQLGKTLSLALGSRQGT